MKAFFKRSQHKKPETEKRMQKLHVILRTDENPVPVLHIYGNDQNGDVTRS